MLTKSDIKNVSLEKAPESVNFCSAWSAAKVGLELLVGIVKNPLVKVSIEMIIKLGDGLCHTK